MKGFYRLQLILICRFGCGHTAQNLPSGGCSEPCVGDTSGYRGVAIALISPGGGQPVVGHDDISRGMACSGSQGVGLEPQALRAVAIEPVGDVILSLRRRTDVGPANEILVPQRSIANKVK